MRKKIQTLLLLAIFSIFAWTIFTNRPAYLTSYNASYWQGRYEVSQWAKGYESTQTMGDAELYAYAGWRQIQGEDPTKLNTEMPPFGKYLLGLSILIFGNASVQAPIFGALFLMIVFFWSRRVLKDTLWALIPVLLIVTEPLFLADLATSMLDLPFALFVTLSFYYLAKGRDNHKFYLPSLIFLSMAATTKIYQASFALLVVFALYLLFLLVVYRYRDIFWFIAFLPFFIISYFAVYIVYFLNGHGLVDFKELHFWIRYFGRVHVTNYAPGEIFRIFFLGRWKTWWGGSGVEVVSVWRPWWVLGFASIPFSLWRGFIGKNLDLLILSFWPVSFLFMYSFGVPYPRYILVILPPLYILLCYNLKSAFEKWKK